MDDMFARPEIRYAQIVGYQNSAIITGKPGKSEPGSTDKITELMLRRKSKS
jgi:hypothetical protein